MSAIQINTLTMEKLRKNKLKMAISIIALIIMHSCSSDCRNEKKNIIRELPIQHISDIEQINSMILRNIKLLEDSCCKNLGSSCSEPDSIRKNYFYPATKHLLNKYLPKTEIETLKLIELLCPGSTYSNEDIVISNFEFRNDSTVKYPVFNALCGDTITEHFIIFQNNSENDGNFYSNNTDYIQVVQQKIIKPNWTYYIIKYLNN